MALLTKDEILKSVDLAWQDIEVKEWGGTVRVRVMTGADRDKFEQMIFNSKGKDKNFNQENFRVKLLVMTLANESNERLFTEEDIAELAKKSSVPMDRLCEVAMQINRIGAKDVEEMTKNL